MDHHFHPDLAFWAGDGDSNQKLEAETQRLLRLMTRMTTLGRAHFERLHLDVSSWWIKHSLPLWAPRLLGIYGACPRVLTLSMPHTSFKAMPQIIMQFPHARFADPLNSPALARLEETRLELLWQASDRRRQIPLGPQVKELPILVGTLRSLETRPRQSEKGPVRMVLQPSPPDVTIPVTGKRRGKENTAIDGTVLEIELTTLIWKAEAVEDAHLSTEGIESWNHWGQETLSEKPRSLRPMLDKAKRKEKGVGMEEIK